MTHIYLVETPTQYVTCRLDVSACAFIITDFPQITLITGKVNLYLCLINYVWGKWKCRSTILDLGTTEK
jgi:hypothetical protein